MTVCEAWAAADWLARHNQPYPQPPCDHDPADCPPLTDESAADWCAVHRTREPGPDRCTECGHSPTGTGSCPACWHD